METEDLPLDRQTCCFWQRVQQQASWSWLKGSQKESSPTLEISQELRQPHQVAQVGRLRCAKKRINRLRGECPIMEGIMYRGKLLRPIRTISVVATQYRTKNLPHVYLCGAGQQNIGDLR